MLCLDPSRKHIRQQNALHSKQALLTAVHGNVGDAAAVACVYAAFHVLCMLGCLGHTDVLCLDPCSKHIRQQNALHSRQALLSAVHGNVGDAAAVACVYAAFHVLCMLGCLGHTACAVSGSLQQAYQTAECFAQQTSIAHCCAWQCRRCAAVACVYAAFHVLCMLGCLGHTDVLCLDPCSKHIRQQNALHSKQALLTAVHGNVGDAAAVACVYAAFHVLCMLGCLGHTDVLCLDPCSKHIRQQNALHSNQALLSAVHGNVGDAAAVACV